MTRQPAATVALLLALPPAALVALGVPALPVAAGAAAYALLLAGVLRLVRD